MTNDEYDKWLKQREEYEMRESARLFNAVAGPSKEERALDVQVGGSHYKTWKIQPIEFLQANKVPPCEANIIKYVCRHREKNGIEDLKKAQHYIQLLIDLEYAKEERYDSN